MDNKIVQLFRPKYEVEECMQEIRKVLESGWSGLGPKCSALENEWAEFTGAKHCHFVNSATSALHIAVRLLDLPRGSVIATTPITFVSTNAAIVYEGHKPVFCDVGDDLNLKFESVWNAIEKKGAKAVIWVHYGGNVSPDFYKLMEWVRGTKIKVIEDCAHAAGAFYADDTRVGSNPDTTSCFSFHSVKNMPIFDGGMICVPTQEMRDRAGKLSWLGIDKSTYSRTVNGANEVYKWSYDVPELGWKYNANDIAASIGLVQLKYLDRDNAYRKALYEHYLNHLVEFPDDSLKAKPMRHADGSAHHLMVAMVKNRDGIIAALKANGYAPGVHYLPNYKFPAFMDYDHETCENVEVMAKNIISLPNHLMLTYKDVEAVCEVMKNV